MLCDYPTLWNRTTKLWLNNAGVMPHHLSNGKTFKQYVSHKMCKESKYLQFILKVSTSCIYAGMQTSMPLSDGFVDSFLIKTIPLQQNALAKFLNVLDSCFVNAFLQDPPDFIIYGLRDWGLGCWVATDLQRWSPASLDWAGSQFLVLCEPELHPAERWRTRKTVAFLAADHASTVDRGNTGSTMCTLVRPSAAMPTDTISDLLNVARVRSRRQDGTSFFEVPNGAYRRLFCVLVGDAMLHNSSSVNQIKFINDAG